MDEVTSQTEAQPKIMSTQPSPRFFSFKIILPVLVFLILVLVGFNLVLDKYGRFWERKPTPQTTALPTLPPSGSQLAFEPPSSISEFLATYFGCPVSADVCKTGKAVQFQNNPALLYSLAPKTEVHTAAPAIDLRPISSQETKGIRYTVIKDDLCYTFSYILGKDAELLKFDLLPRPKGEIVARAGGENLVIQLQKRALEDDADLPIFRRCGLLEPTGDGKSFVERKDFGVFEKITPELFKVE